MTTKTRLAEIRQQMIALAREAESLIAAHDAAVDAAIDALDDDDVDELEERVGAELNAAKYYDFDLLAQLEHDDCWPEIISPAMAKALLEDE